VALEAERRGPRQIAQSAGKIGQTPTFMKAPMLLDKGGFALQTFTLARSLKNGIDLISDVATVSEYFSNDVAFEGVGFADRMVPAGFRFMLQGAPV
jgi:hypothetical protein